ncbi:MAG: zf-TFIIB domain-containing protein [Gemmatimonadetes bacterium]|nr:zf-TFIIB domain-containing protein [Gemmatimonadota bacterium]
MNCLACGPQTSLRPETSPDGLPLRRCPECSGRWVRADDYQRWVGRGSRALAQSVDETPTPDDDSERRGFRRCPDDDYFLTRTKLSAPGSFSIDRCRHCSGMWFDRDEWESLEQAGLARELPVVLPDDWDEQLQARRGQP